MSLAGVMLCSASAATQPPPQLEKKFPRLERAAMVVKLQVAPPARAAVGQDVTMKVTVENSPFLVQGTAAA